MPCHAVKHSSALKGESSQVAWLLNCMGDCRGYSAGVILYISTVGMHEGGAMIAPHLHHDGTEWHWLAVASCVSTLCDV